ncbi:MAG: choice-of-anchor J domain-containing protein [Bacteroidetes bacterium]|nr:choice-of-anchor J domain-containing protein [Bacteroidota bacterium]
MKKHLLFKFLLTFTLALFTVGWVNGQTTIAVQDFDGGTPEWSYTNDVTFFDNTWGGDGYYGIIAASSASPLDMASFSGNIIGENDLDDEGDNGTAGFATLSFGTVDISSYTNVEITFDYDVVGYNANDDDAKYIVYYDGTPQSDVLIVDGGVDPTDAEGSITISVPGGTNTVALDIAVRDNGSTGYSGFDNIKITGTELNPNDNTSTVNSSGATQPAAANIASTIDTQGEAVAVFQFNIEDAASGDGLPTEVTAITIKAGPNNTADWTSDIGGGYLYKEGTGPLTITTEPDVQADQVTFYIDDGELDIADGGSQLVTLYVWLSTSVTDNAVIQCMVDADSHGFISDIAGSGFASDFGTDVTGNDITIDVTSTQFSFLTQPSNVVTAVAMDPAVEIAATDANGSIDTDYTSDITLTFSGSGTMTGTNPVTAVSGVATFSDLTFDTEETNVTLAANDGSLPEATSETFGVYGMVTVSPPYTRDFETGDINTDGWTTQLVTGTLDWEIASFGGDSYAQMSNYDAGSNHASETWLISPAVDLSGATTAIFGFYNACKDFAGTSDDIEVYISSDYDGTSAPSAATWDQLSPALSPGDYDDVYSGDIDISSYTGGSVHVAFKYIGTDTDGKTWQVDDVSIITDPPVISNFATTPASPTSSDAVTISADINDNGSVASASLSWGLTSGDYSEGTITMSEGVAPNFVADATIPAQAEAATVYYVVSATDDDGLTTTSDEQSYTIPRSEAHVTSGVYTVVDGTPGTISNIPNGTTLATFKSNITAPPGGTFEVYVSDGGAVATDLQDGYFLTGTAEDGTTEADYNIEVSDIVPDTDSDVSAPTMQVAAATVAVVDGDETAEAFEVFSFDITDAGTADGLPTYVRQIVLYYGPNMTLDLNTDDLADGWFVIDGTTEVTIENEPIIGEDSIAFTFSEGDITVPDAGSINVTLKVVLDPHAADGNVVQFMIPATDHGFETVGISSEFPATFAGGDITGNDITIEVVATELSFSTEPTNVYVGNNIEPAVVVEAIDANGNIDTDYVTDIAITATGATLTSAVSETPVAGVATFSAISFSDDGTGVTLTAASGSLTDATSTTFDVRVEPENDLFISEYIEGSGSNKAIELYNPNTVAVDLSEYTIKQSHNGSGWGTDGIAYVLPLEGMVAAGDVYVVANAQADAAIIDVADTTFAYSEEQGHKVPSFNGDDAMGLFKNDVLIDVIGVPDEATEWDVADTTAATGEHTIMRKYEITTGNTDWAASAGTNYDDSEWIVFGQDFIANLGLVSFQAPAISDVTIAPTTPTATDEVTVSATITDGDTETANLTASLMYGSAEGSEDTEVTFTETATADVFEGTIPASSATVYYKVTAADEYFNTEHTGSYSITTGIGTPDGIVSMNIFPNPNNGMFTLEMNASKAGSFNVQIINIQGQVVYNKEVNQDGFYKEQIDISNEASGIYYIRINDGKNTKVSKIMIQ